MENPTLLLGEVGISLPSRRFEENHVSDVVLWVKFSMAYPTVGVEAERFPIGVYTEGALFLPVSWEGRRDFTVIIPPPMEEHPGPPFNL